MVYLYAIIAGSSDLIFGWLALQQWANKIQPRYVIAFAAGGLLAVTFFDILPEADLKSDALFLALGFVTFYVLEKVMMIHACGETECDTHHIGPIAVLGMALDNVVDGAGIAVGKGSKKSAGKGDRASCSTDTFLPPGAVLGYVL